MSRRIIPTDRDLHLMPLSSLPVHPHPLRLVIHGSFNAGFVDPSIPVDPAAHDLLSDCLRFAQQLITHPSVLPRTAKILAFMTGPDVLVIHAIRKVLSTRQWVICLDSGLDYWRGASLHSSSTEMSTVVSAAEDIIFLDTQYVERLIKAFSAGSSGGIQARTFVLTAVAITSAMVHALRLQVKYELRPYSEFNYDLPIDFHDQELSSECAADLEQDAFGGILEGIWDHQSPPTNYGRFENEDMTAFMHRSEKENEESRLEKKALVARLSQKRPIDSLTIVSMFRFYPQGSMQQGRKRISNDWSVLAYNEFRDGELHRLPLPIVEEAAEDPDTVEEAVKPDPIDDFTYISLERALYRVRYCGHDIPQPRNPRYTDLRFVPITRYVDDLICITP